MRGREGKKAKRTAKRNQEETGEVHLRCVNESLVSWRVEMADVDDDVPCDQRNERGPLHTDDASAVCIDVADATVGGQTGCGKRKEKAYSTKLSTAMAR